MDDETKDLLLSLKKVINSNQTTIWSNTVKVYLPLVAALVSVLLYINTIQDDYKDVKSDIKETKRHTQFNFNQIEKALNEHEDHTIHLIDIE